MAFALVLGVYTRFVGLTHGTTDFVVSAKHVPTQSFFNFHPDEETLIRASLSLTNLLEPPLTAYGMMPLYVLKLAFSTLSLFSGQELEIDNVESSRAVFIVARSISATISVFTLVLVFIVFRHLGNATATIAVWCTASAPMVIQQAHFYTVDGFFTLSTLVAFGAIVKSLKSEDASCFWYVGAGVAIASVGAIRLNGLLLGLILLFGYFFHALQAGKSWRHMLVCPNLILAIAMAISTFFVLQPYLLFNPGSIIRTETTNDFAFSLAIASGELLRIWSLADVHTTPFIYHWTHLMRQGMGLPMSILFAVAVMFSLVQVFYRRSKFLSLTVILALLWVGIYFAVISCLFTKHVRYLVPVVPFLSLFVGQLAVRVYHIGHSRLRMIGTAGMFLVLASTAIYGGAFAQIYRNEDSRVEASRWLSNYVPHGKTIGIETGAFSMIPLIDKRQFVVRSLNMPALFESRGYLTCTAAVDFIEERVAPLNYIVFTDVNRWRPFSEVPELFPSVSLFYEMLTNNKLGFSQVAYFKNNPNLFGAVFDDSHSEISFLAYDHPPVYVLKRVSAEAVRRGFRDWKDSLPFENCADDLLKNAIVAATVGQTKQASEYLRIAEGSAHSRLAKLLQNGMGPGGIDLMPEALAKIARKERRQQHVIPWAVALSATHLNTPELGLPILIDGAKQAKAIAPWARAEMVKAYVHLGKKMIEYQFLDAGEKVFLLSASISENAAAYNGLAQIAATRGNLEAAITAAERSLTLDPSQAHVFGFVADIAIRGLKDSDRGLPYLRRAIDLDPRLSTELSGLLPK